MARPETPELTTYWKIRINSSLAARVELSMWDATHKKPKYGSRKALIEYLLTEWLQREAPGEAIEGPSHASGV